VERNYLAKARRCKAKHGKGMVTPSEARQSKGRARHSTAKQSNVMVTPSKA